MWNAGDLGIVARHKAHDRAVTALSAARDGGLLATAGADGRLKIWKIGSGNPVEQLVIPTEKPITCLGWSRDAKVLIGGGSDRMLRYWTTANLAEISKIKAHDGAITALAVVQ